MTAYSALEKVNGVVQSSQTIMEIRHLGSTQIVIQSCTGVALNTRGECQNSRQWVRVPAAIGVIVNLVKILVEWSQYWYLCSVRVY